MAPDTPPAPPAADAGRDRLRLLLVLGLLGAWLLRWTSTRDAFAAGPDRTGAVAAAALLLLWGLSVTGARARTARGARRGEALTDAALAAVLALLLAGAHPWAPGGALRPVLAAPFVTLALLALLDAWRGAEDPAYAWLRALAALAAAVLFFKKGAPGPAGALLWLALAPVWMRGAGARRRLEVLVLLAAVLAFVAPGVNRALTGGEPASGVYEGRFVWQALAVAVGLVTLPRVLGRVRSPES